MNAVIDQILSGSFQEILKSGETENLINIDPDLRELIVAAACILGGEHIIWLVGENENFVEKREKLNSWLRLLGAGNISVCLFKLPFEDPYVNNHFDGVACSNKIELILELLKGKKLIVISTLAALSIRIEKHSLLNRFMITLRVDDTVNRDRFISRLLELGYQSRDFVGQEGEMSWRGGIVDVFPVNEENPVRVEFWGGEVKSIRFFNIQTQKSIRKTDEVFVSQSRYFLHQATLADYLSGNRGSLVTLPGLLKNVRLIASDFKRIRREFDTLLNHFSRIRDLSSHKKEGFPEVSEIFDFPLSRFRVMSIDDVFNGVTEETEIVKIKKCLLEFNQKDIEDTERKISERSFRCTVGSEDKKILNNLELYWGTFHRVPFNFPVSFQNPVTRNLFLTHKNFEISKKEVLSESEASQSDQLLDRIKPDDFVVHKKHGIGKFIGIQKLEFDGSVSEFLKIEYQNEEFLYVPVYELDVLSKYMAFEGTFPRIDKLGGKTWQNKKSRAKRSMVSFARDLLELYALRRSIKGISYPGDYDLENRLQQGFHFVETRDQKSALRDVMEDLESDVPMDRLICGDVSFGKTEVALRAVFRVVLGGKQVAMLCPTTILAWQHFKTFRKRFADFPVRVELLSRMVTPGRKKEIYQDLEKGKIDVVIGTHSLISREIPFKKLGLVVVDEEQRFGVFQKEKLKRNREDIDVLALSATPIPRTLSLTLSGLQDLSTIQSPPIGRRAVKNYVGYFSKQIVISAILNEGERDGQVFLVYNNIERIFSFKERLQSWLPDVSMAVIHAKMRSETIEANLMDFINKKFQVLISTTIIENGIDIPDVNTLIVIEADRFGLTQLYQLRGRIGRGSRQGYAYFLVRSPAISDKAKSRLQAIREFSELGSGYKLAEFDLKLRGMGSLLGNRQHGHIEALGFDYYLKLLQEMVRKLKGETGDLWEPKINIHFPYSIDREYISDSSERIRYYKKILELRRIEEILELKSELIDRFGPVHETIEKILFVALIRVIAYRFRFREVEIFADKVVITVGDEGIEPSIRGRDFFKKFTLEKSETNKYILFINGFQSFFNDLTQQSSLF